MMLVDFRVSNFRSFAEEKVLSMVASRDSTLEGNLVPPEVILPRTSLRLLKAAVVYGANASGKSNLYKAMSAFNNTVARSATKLSEGDPLPGISPFRLDPRLRDEPSRFEIRVLIGGALWRYGFAATSTHIAEEWLSVAQAGGRETEWFHRYGNDKKQWVFGPRLRGRQRTLVEETRPDNCLVLSTAARVGAEQLSPLHRWIRKRLWHIDLSTAPEFLSMQTADRCKNEEALCHGVEDLIRRADLGISSIQMRDVDLEFPRVPSGDSEAEQFLRQAVELFKNLKPVKIPRVKTYHAGLNPSEVIEFDIEDESKGTQRLFALAGPILTAISSGATLILDEIDCSLHPWLVRELVVNMQDPEVNRTGAQLVCMTHDTSLQDPDLLRRDQIWFTEKDQSGATDLYSLYDFAERPRLDAPFARGYLAGKYGGVPVFGNLRRAFLDVARVAEPAGAASE